MRPAWEDGVAGIGGDGAATIFIEPGVGFGTGLHATTQLCLAAIAARRHRGGSCDRVLDFSRGSGIVAIAAAVCGARQVAAIEIDDRVHGAIVANARRNGVADQVTVAATIPAAAGSVRDRPRRIGVRADGFSGEAVWRTISGRFDASRVVTAPERLAWPNSTFTTPR